MAEPPGGGSCFIGAVWWYLLTETPGSAATNEQPRERRERTFSPVKNVSASRRARFRGAWMMSGASCALPFNPAALFTENS